VGGNTPPTKSRPRCPSGANHGPGRLSISRLLQQILNESGLRRSQFIQATGFKNTTKGLKRLDEWLGTGCGHKVCLERIVDRYNSDPAALQSGLAETEAIHKREYQASLREQEERERRLFRPFLWVVTEDGAHSWVMAMAQRAVKLLRFPGDFKDLSKGDQLAAVQQMVRDHYQKTGGHSHYFGAIQRYRFCDS
jgi:hypothetical protein